MHRFHIACTAILSYTLLSLSYAPHFHVMNSDVNTMCTAVLLLEASLFIYTDVHITCTAFPVIRGSYHMHRCPCQTHRVSCCMHRVSCHAPTLLFPSDAPQFRVIYAVVSVIRTAFLSYASPFLLHASELLSHATLLFLSHALLFLSYAPLYL